MTYVRTALTVACLVTTGFVSETAHPDETPPGDSDAGAGIQSSVRDGLELESHFEPFKLNLGTLQTDSPESSLKTDEWRVDFTMWAWLSGITGDVGVRGLTTNVNADIGDVLDASDSILAFSGRLEFGKDRWGIFIDGTYMKIGVDDVSGPLGFAAIDITNEMFLIDFGVTYRLGEWTPNSEAVRNSRDITLDLYAGGRYTKLDLELNPALLASRSGDKEWLDPIVGAKLVLPINQQWHIAANGDIGGFGVESDFTWSTTVVFGSDFMMFDHPATMYIGYRAVGWDFTEGSGSERFTWDVVMHGPILGLLLQF